MTSPDCRITRAPRTRPDPDIPVSSGCRTIPTNTPFTWIASSLTTVWRPPAITAGTLRMRSRVALGATRPIGRLAGSIVMSPPAEKLRHPYSMICDVPT